MQAPFLLCKLGRFLVLVSFGVCFFCLAEAVDILLSFSWPVMWAFVTFVIVSPLASFGNRPQGRKGGGRRGVVIAEMEPGIMMKISALFPGGSEKASICRPAASVEKRASTAAVCFSGDVGVDLRR